jgi:SulP family sulfate permease
MGRLFSQLLSGPDALSLLPLVKDAQGYTFQKARSDISAAVSVALLSIPQALAYSILVGVPPIAGIISMVLGTAIAALLTSSSHLVIGPNNATCLLVQAAIMESFQKFYVGAEGVSRADVSLELITTMTLLIGISQLVASFFKLGRLIQFVSHAVVVGYIAGTAMAIAVSQLFPLTGVVCPDTLDTLYQKVSYWALHIKEAQPLTLAVGGASLLLIGLMRRLRWKFPASLAMLTVMTGVVALLGIYGLPEAHGKTVQLIACGDVSSLAFSFNPPVIELRYLNSLLPIAFAIALIGMLEANTIAKSIAATTGQRLTGNQEVFALGCSNFFLSLCGGLPCSGSATRSNLNLETGAKTRFAAFYSSIIVVLLTLCLGPVITFVPTASLAALLIATALRIVDTAQIRLCWRATRSDGLVLTVTFLSCIFFSLPLAFYMGVALSIILYLRKAATPRVVEYIYEESTGEICQANEEEKRLPHAIRMINVEGELFFGAMDLFQHTLRAIAEDDLTTKVIILRLKHVHDLDATTALGLRQLKDYLSQSGRHLIVCSIPPHVLELLENVHLVDHLGRDNVVLFDSQAPHTWLEKALHRARYLLSHDDTPFASQEESTDLIPAPVAVEDTVQLPLLRR